MCYLCKRLTHESSSYSRFLTVAGFLLCMLPVQLQAQLSAGSISGLVTDPAAAIVPRAKVQIRNQATSITSETTTNEIGFYVFTGVLPAVYDLTVTAQGFNQFVLRGVQLLVNQGSRLDVKLQLGGVTERIEVVGSAAPLMESVSSKVGTIVETKQIMELPLNGRQFAQLILLTPGALPISLGQSASFKVQLGSGSYSPVINGQRSRFQTYSLDGAENNDPMFNSYSINPSVDAIQEFTVQSRGSAGDYGRSAGSNVIVVTRSGTNEFHGSAWEYFRNTKLDARNFFDPKRPDYKQNQFGGTFGGPLMLPHYDGHQRTFFFGYYEGFRSRRSANSIDTVPTEAMRNGDFSAPGLPTIYDIATTRADSTSPAGYVRDAFLGNRLPTSRIDRNLQPFFSLFPLPNLPGITKNYINTSPNAVRNDQASLRLDHKLSDADNLFGRISYNNGIQTTPGSIPVNYSATVNVAWNATVSETHIFRPNLIGHFQFGFNRYTSNIAGNYIPDNLMQAIGWDKVFPRSAPSLMNLRLAMDDIILGIGQVGNGLAGNFIPIGPHNTYQAIGDMTWVRGRHTLKAGLTRNTTRSFQASPTGVVNFVRYPTSNLIDQKNTGYGAATFLLGLPTSATRTLGDTSARLSNNEYHIFLMDEARLTSKLIWTIGLQWSYVQAMKEARNAIAGLDYITGNYLVSAKNPITGEGPNVRERRVDPEWRNFAPRMGLAYALDNKTTIRTGAGIHYSFTDAIQYSADGAGSWPFGFNEQVGPLNQFFADTPASNPLRQSPGLNLAPTPFGQGGKTIDPRMKSPKAVEWDFSVQRLLPGEVLLDATYVGSNTIRMIQLTYLNRALPGPGPVQPRRRWPNYGSVGWETNGPPSSYNALTMKLQKRFGSGLSFLANYTWSHNLDVYSTERNAQGVQDPLNYRADHASSQADMTRAFLFSNVWELPFGRNRRFLRTGIVSHILSNWQWSNILGLYSGTPFNVTLGFDNANNGGSSQRPNLVADPTLSNPTRMRWFNTAAFGQPAPFTYGNAGRNILRGPGLKNWDMALAKNFPFGEKRSLQFRGEFFNTCNFVNFGLPDGNFSSQSFGLISSAGNARSIQFTLRLAF